MNVKIIPKERRNCNKTQFLLHGYGNFSFLGIKTPSAYFLVITVLTFDHPEQYFLPFTVLYVLTLT